MAPITEAPRKTGCPTTTTDPARDALVAQAVTESVAAVANLSAKRVRQTWFTYHRRLAQAMATHGIVDTANALNAAVATGVPAAAVCTSLIMESGGGHNVWGGDPGGNALPWQWFEKPVTRAEWNVYWHNVTALGLTTNGCGGMQLTNRSLQQAAQDAGGCYLSGPNFRVGAVFLRQLLTGTRGDVQLAFQHYNGSGPAAEQYGRNAFALYQQLHAAFVAVR